MIILDDIAETLIGVAQFTEQKLIVKFTNHEVHIIHESGLILYRGNLDIETKLWYVNIGDLMRITNIPGMIQQWKEKNKQSIRRHNALLGRSNNYNQVYVEHEQDNDIIINSDDDNGNAMEIVNDNSKQENYEISSQNKGQRKEKQSRKGTRMAKWQIQFIR